MFGRAGVDGGAGGGAGGAGFEGFGGFSDIFDAFFGGAAGGGSARRGRPQPGADLRYDLRITFEEAVKGTEKEIEFRVLRPLRRPAPAAARRTGTEPITCPQCQGRGEIRSVRQTMLGQMVNVSACPRCGGEGKIVETPCDDLPRRRPHGAQALAAGHHPGRHRRGPPDPPDQRGRGRARAADRPAACTWPSMSPRTRRSSATAPSSTTRPTSRSPRRRSGRGSRSRPSTATRRSRSRPAPSPTPRSGCAARACRTCAGPDRAATCTCSSTSSSRPSCRSGSGSCWRPTPRSPARHVGHAGGLREKLGRPRLRAARRAGAESGRRPGAWLELSVVADLEAVEAVSEILGRYRQRRDDRGAGLRPRRGGPRGAGGPDPSGRRFAAYVPARDRVRGRGRRRRGRRGAGPPPGVRAADHRRAADPDRPRGGLGRRLEGVLPGPAHRSADRHPTRPGDAIDGCPTTSSSPWTRAWPSGPACTRRRACAWRPWSRSPIAATLGGRARPRRRLWLGDPGHRRAEARRGDARSVWTPTRSPSRRPLANARRNRLVRRVRAREWAACRAASRPFDVVLANLIAGVLVPLRRPCTTSCDRAAPSSRRASSSTARRRSSRRSRRPGLAVAARTAEGDWVALEARRPVGRLTRPRPVSGPTPYNRPRCPRTCSRSCSSAHIILAISLVLPSILLPFALRTRRATVESDSRVVQGLLYAQSHGTVAIGAGPGADRARPRGVPRAPACSSSRGCCSR